MFSYAVNGMRKAANAQKVRLSNFESMYVCGAILFAAVLSFMAVGLKYHNLLTEL